MSLDFVPRRDELDVKAEEKPLKGEKALDRKQTRRDRVKAEQAEMRAALVRDRMKCRYPRCTTGFTVDPCHQQHRGMGGNPKVDRTTRQTVIALCRRHHDEYDRAWVSIEPLTDQVFDGPCAFYRVTEAGKFEHVASERTIGVSEARS